MVTVQNPDQERKERPIKYGFSLAKDTGIFFKRQNKSI
jgi:hypothetical protein